MTYPKLESVFPLDDYKLALTYGGDDTRVYDFKPNLDHKYYAPLKEQALFRQVSVVDGDIEWVTGQDFCPHTLYDQSVPCETASYAQKQAAYA